MNVEAALSESILQMFQKKKNCLILVESVKNLLLFRKQKYFFSGKFFWIKSIWWSRRFLSIFLHPCFSIFLLLNTEIKIELKKFLPYT